MSLINFYFEYSSPYSAISALRIQQLYTKGIIKDADLTLHPILLGIIFKNTNNLGPKSNPTKMMYMVQDFPRASKKVLDLELTLPSKFPFNSVLATMVTYYLIEQKYELKSILDFVCSVYLASFQSHLDISNIGVIKSCLVKSFPNANVDEIINEASNVKFKNIAKHNTQNAMEKGIFGAPSFIVKDELFWGQDRFDLALEAAKIGNAKL